MAWIAEQCRGRGADEFVFPSAADGPIRLNNWRRRVFDPACERAGIEDFTPHDLRHTAACLAVAAGGNVKAVQQMLGHASAAMTLDIYAGLFPDDLDAVATSLDAHVPLDLRPAVRVSAPADVPQMCHNGDSEPCERGQNEGL